MSDATLAPPQPKLNSSSVCEMRFIAHTPWLLHAEDLYGFDLGFQTVGQAKSAQTPDFLGIDWATCLNGYTGFVQTPMTALALPELADLPREQLILQLKPNFHLIGPGLATQQMHTLQALKEAGFRFALELSENHFTQSISDAKNEALFNELLELAEFVFLPSASSSFEVLQKQYQAIHARKPQLPIGVFGIAQRDELERCKKLGCHYFSGSYFYQTERTEAKLAQNEIALLRLLSLLLADAEGSAIEEVFHTEPGLALGLLRLVNSAALSPGREIDSLRAAINFLGRRQLQRWVNLLLFAQSGAHKTNAALLHRVALRGRILELTMQTLNRSDSSMMDKGFMVGVVSMAPIVMGLSVGELIRVLRAPADMEAALLRRQGLLGGALQIVEELENQAGMCSLEILLKRIGLAPSQLWQIQLSAFEWANQLRGAF